MTQPIRPVDWREPSVTAPGAVDGVPRVRLLTPAEREDARRRREQARRQRTSGRPEPPPAQERRSGVDYSV